MKFLNHKNTKNLMLINTIYHKGKKDTDYIDYLDIVYKDLNTDEKFVETIEEPKMEIYFAQEDKRNYKHNKTFLHLSDAEKHTVPYRRIGHYIANQAGDNWKNEFSNSLRSGNFGASQNIHKYPYVFGSDLDIEPYYRIMWMQEYENESPKKPSKIYADIEVDGIDIAGFPKDGNCPVNACTVFDELSKVCYTLLLRNPDNPLIDEFEANIDGFVSQLHEAFDETYGKIDYRIYMYDKETDLIRDIFNLINTLKRDFCLFWNGYGFDYPFLIDRMNELGMDPAKTACHPDFKIKEFYHVKDRRNFAINMKKDYVKCSSYTIFADQMIYYAQLRKGQSELRSNTLSYVAQHEIKDNKLDYHEEADIKTLPYKNYELFTMYNIKD